MDSGASLPWRGLAHPKCPISRVPISCRMCDTKSGRGGGDGNIQRGCTLPRLRGTLSSNDAVPVPSSTLILRTAVHPGCHFRKQTASTSKHRVRPLPRRSMPRMASFAVPKAEGERVRFADTCFAVPSNVKSVFVHQSLSRQRRSPLPLNDTPSTCTFSSEAHPRCHSFQMNSKWDSMNPHAP